MEMWRSLSQNVEDTLILHTQMLSNASGFFRAGLSKEWVHNKVSGTEKVAGTSVPIKKYGLEWVKGDWILKGRVGYCSLG